MFQKCRAGRVKAPPGEPRRKQQPPRLFVLCSDREGPRTPVQNCAADIELDPPAKAPLARTAGTAQRKFVGPPAATELSSPWALWATKTDLFIVEGGAHDLRRAPGLAGEIIARMIF